MRLYHLKLKKDEHSYDAVVEMVVRARDEQHARELSKAAVPFSRDDFMHDEKVSCELLSKEGDPGVIINNIRWG
jgi:hypothetical protein